MNGTIDQESLSGPWCAGSLANGHHGGWFSLGRVSTGEGRHRKELPNAPEMRIRVRVGQERGSANRCRSLPGTRLGSLDETLAKADRGGRPRRAPNASADSSGAFITRGQRTKRYYVVVTSHDRPTNRRTCPPIIA